MKREITPLCAQQIMRGKDKQEPCSSSRMYVACSSHVALVVSRAPGRNTALVSCDMSRMYCCSLHTYCCRLRGLMVLEMRVVIRATRREREEANGLHERRHVTLPTPKHAHS